MIVEQCMSKSPRACTPADTLSSVAQILWDHDLGALPVVDQAGAVVGMITDRDLCMAAYTSGLSLHACLVGRHMSRTVFSIGAKSDTAKAAELMKSRKVRRLPVVENGRLVGMLTLTDLARRARALPPAEVAALLADVAAPRTPAAAAPVALAAGSRKVKSLLKAKPRTLAKKR